MIRDPSDGSVREASNTEVAELRNHATPDTGLRQPTRTDAQIRLERSREWLKDYHAKQGAPHADGGNDGKEHSAGGDSSGQNARSTVE